MTESHIATRQSEVEDDAQLLPALTITRIRACISGALLVIAFPKSIRHKPRQPTPMQQG